MRLFSQGGAKSDGWLEVVKGVGWSKDRMGMDRVNSKWAAEDGGPNTWR